jgi:hypothetical protein
MNLLKQLNNTIYETQQELTDIRNETEPEHIHTRHGTLDNSEWLKAERDAHIEHKQKLKQDLTINGKPDY